MVAGFYQRLLQLLLVVYQAQRTDYHQGLAVGTALFDGTVSFLPMYLVGMGQTRLILFVRLVQLALHHLL